MSDFGIHVCPMALLPLQECTRRQVVTQMLSVTMMPLPRPQWQIWLRWHHGLATRLMTEVFAVLKILHNKWTMCYRDTIL
jgi:hypothetical protein